MKISNIPVAAMALNLGQSLATTCALNRFFPKSTQKLCSGASFKQNQQLAASRCTVFPTETVQIHTESAQIHTETVPSSLPQFGWIAKAISVKAAAETVDRKFTPSLLSQPFRSNVAPSRLSKNSPKTAPAVAIRKNFKSG